MKKVIRNIHLWLGFASGLVIFILGITGCLLAFEIEIRNATEDFRKVAVEQKPLLPPGLLKAKGEEALDSRHALVAEYGGPGKAALLSYYDATHYELAFFNPYSGQLLQHKNMKKDFFRIVIDGHYYLWLPPSIGQPVVATATLIFLLLLITGIVLWWPKNRHARRQRFTLKLNARWRRKNYDLHTVLGFYMSWIAVFLVITGLVMGFQWFARSFYFVTSGGRAMVAHTDPASIPSPHSTQHIADKVWPQYADRLAGNKIVQFYFPSDPAGSLEVVVNNKPGTYYHTDVYHHDQYTGKLLAPGERFSNAGFADKLAKMNYDIHVGAVLGLPGKLLAFFASLIAASLPVTGFMIWWGRRRQTKKHLRPVLRSLRDGQ